MMMRYNRFDCTCGCIEVICLFMLVVGLVDRTMVYVFSSFS